MSDHEAANPIHGGGHDDHGSHGSHHATPKSGKEEKFISNVSDEERIGLTSEEAERRIAEFGYNELPEIKVSLWYVFFLQFTGTMPYMLELAAIVSFGCQDWPDAGVICAMLIANGVLGFHEQMKAAKSLAELTNKMEQKIAILRDGKAEHMLTRLLVPGDVVLLLGGVQVAADIEWFDGDVLQVDTAALTGEPLPRKYPSKEHGSLILCASTIRAGEAYGIVRKTGSNTEIGSTNVDIMKDKTVARVSVFEQKVLQAVLVIISIALIDVFVIFIVQGTYRKQFNTTDITADFLACLSIIVAAIPVALPIVLQVTMALGAGKMAREYSSVVTALPALQDIASMTILCSDKTGTLTTARISIHAESVWCSANFTKQDVALYAVLASNRDKKEDAIDRSVVGYFDRVFGDGGLQLASEYTKTRSVGFNPIYKRVLYEYSHPKVGKITIAKGLPNKVLDTADGGADDAEDQWKCQDYLKLRDEVKKVDYDFSKAGYKTLGVAVKINDGPFVFCGILPMLDPPRHDTAQTIRNLVNAGIEVKMITGDHLNIAKETARLIGMGVDIQPGEATREESHSANPGARFDLIRAAHGFAQVLPKDKREVVQVLRNHHNQVVGMTGDGVNDAPALSAAQCGIAVHDATDAAKNAAAIILTSEGLSAIYSAVVESRRIFRKLKSYTTYRFAATIQFVIVLTLIIFISNCVVNSLFIVLLALLNDLTMLPIAYDFQLASKAPEKPIVYKMLIVSASLGVLEMIFSIIFCYAAEPSLLFRSNFAIKDCGTTMQGAIWVQLFVASELLIFSARSPCLIPSYIAPSLPLCASVFTGCLVVSILAGVTSYFGLIQGTDIVIIWIYDIICLVIIDFFKVYLYYLLEENSDVLPDEETTAITSTGHEAPHDVESTQSAEIYEQDRTDRGSIAADRLTDYAIAKSDRLSRMSLADRLSVASQGKARMSSVERQNPRIDPTADPRISLSYGAYAAGNAYSSVSSSLTAGSSLRPNVPHNQSKY